MIKKIYITYDSNETVTYSFWKQFFLMSGVWVVGNKLENANKADFYNDQIDEYYLHLYLLAEKSLFVIEENDVKQNVFYFIDERNYVANPTYHDRTDVLMYNWKQQNTFIDAIKKIDFREDIKYSKLLKIYIDTSLWLSTWLYFDLAYEKITEWDSWILDNSVMAIENLDILKKTHVSRADSWHYEFMDLYCCYIRTAIENREYEDRKTQVQLLLERGNLLALESGWQPALCNLCAAISSLSPLENKVAIVYYKGILEYDKNSQIMYNIGKIYEKVYGDIEMAVRYYTRADENGRYYRARYKIASYFEQKGEWKKALAIYESIFKALGEKFENPSFNSVTVYDIEYYIKVIIKIKNILTQKFSYSGDGMDRLIEEKKEKIVNLSHLIRMVYCMRQMANKSSVKINIDKNSMQKGEWQRTLEFLKDILKHVQRRIDLYF